MKKKILVLSVVFGLIASGVSASSINGDYKGNPIVKVTSNGKLLEADEVPAQIYDGHTVVPISLLRQIGASVTWDPESYSVNVKLPAGSSSSSSSSEDYLLLSKSTEILRAIYSFEEQFALLSIISLGMIDSVTDKSGMNILSTSLDKVNIEVLNNWVKQFENIGMNQVDIDKFQEVILNISLAKKSALQLNSKDAAYYNNTAKATFNQLAAKYDGMARDLIKLK